VATLARWAGGSPRPPRRVTAGVSADSVT
jgi:hypothetical protein